MKVLKNCIFLHTLLHIHSLGGKLIMFFKLLYNIKLDPASNAEKKKLS
jgi:hypothetical protein